MVTTAASTVVKKTARVRCDSGVSPYRRRVRRSRRRSPSFPCLCRRISAHACPAQSRWQPRGRTQTLHTAITPATRMDTAALVVAIDDLDPKHVADAIIKRKIINIFPAMIEGRCFSLMASVGIDALSVKNVNLRLKKAIGKSAYVFSFIREAMKSKNNSHMVKIKKVEHKSYYTIIAKGRYYAGEYICAPDATIEDKNLHVVMLKKKGLFELFKFFWAILRNKVSSLKHVDIIAASALTVFSKNEEAIQIDGDYYGQLPVTINVAEKAIKLIGPAP